VKATDLLITPSQPVDVPARRIPLTRNVLLGKMVWRDLWRRGSRRASPEDVIPPPIPVNFGVFTSRKNDTAGYTKPGNGFTIRPMRWAGTIVAVLFTVKRESYRKAPLIVSPVGRSSEWDGGLIKSAVRSGVEPAFLPSG
jgi:hypothetical protein